MIGKGDIRKDKNYSYFGPTNYNYNKVYDYSSRLIFHQISSRMPFDVVTQVSQLSPIGVWSAVSPSSSVIQITVLAQTQDQTRDYYYSRFKEGNRSVVVYCLNM